MKPFTLINKAGALLTLQQTTAIIKHFTHNLSLNQLPDSAELSDNLVFLRKTRADILTDHFFILHLHPPENTEYALELI